jgi:hypothetical protein
MWRYHQNLTNDPPPYAGPGAHLFLQVPGRDPRHPVDHAICQGPGIQADGPSVHLDPHAAPRSPGCRKKRSHSRRWPPPVVCRLIAEPTERPQPRAALGKWRNGSSRCPRLRFRTHCRYCFPHKIEMGENSHASPVVDNLSFLIGSFIYFKELEL